MRMDVSKLVGKHVNIQFCHRDFFNMNYKVQILDMADAEIKKN